MKGSTVNLVFAAPCLCGGNLTPRLYFTGQPEAVSLARHGARLGWAKLG